MECDSRSRWSAAFADPGDVRRFDHADLTVSGTLDGVGGGAMPGTVASGASTTSRKASTWSTSRPRRAERVISDRGSVMSAPLADGGAPCRESVLR
jgi:hypothetical protein